MKQVITQEDFQEWKHLVVTQAFLKTLEANREELKENVVNGAYDPNQELEVKGICKSVMNILELTYEELMEGYANVKL